MIRSDLILAVLYVGLCNSLSFDVYEVFEGMVRKCKIRYNRWHSDLILAGAYVDLSLSSSCDVDDVFKGMVQNGKTR